MLHEDRNCGTSYQSAKVVPNLGDVWIEANSAGVGLEGVAVLVDLVIKDAYRAPERWVASFAVDGLLVRLISLWICLL